MGLLGPARGTLFKYRKRAHLSIDSTIPTTDFPSNFAGSAMPNPARHGAPSRQQDYDPIIAAYQEMEAAYELPPSWFEGSIAPRRPAMTSEAKFTGQEAETEATDQPLSLDDEILGAIEQVKAAEPLPEFAREFVDNPVTDSDIAVPPVDMDTIMMAAELESATNQLPAPQAAEATQAFSPLEQLVLAEIPNPGPSQPDYATGQMTLELFQEAMQQANAPQPTEPSTPQPEQPVYDPQLEELLNPYHPMFNPFGIPGHG